MSRPLVEDGALVRIDGLVGTLRRHEEQCRHAYLRAGASGIRELHVVDEDVKLWRFDWERGAERGRRYYEPRSIETGIRRGAVVLVSAEDEAPSTQPAG